MIYIELKEIRKTAKTEEMYSWVQGFYPINEFNLCSSQPDRTNQQQQKYTLTHSHHVVPSVQQAHAELHLLGGKAYDYKTPTQLRALANSRGPSHQEPQNNEENHRQQPEDTPAGHVWCPLGGAGQEHFQHPEGGTKGRERQSES